MRVSRSIDVRNWQHLFYNMCFWQIFENNSNLTIQIWHKMLHINNIYETLEKYTVNANNITNTFPIIYTLDVTSMRLHYIRIQSTSWLLLFCYQVDINFNPLLCHYRTRFVCYVFVHSIHLFNQPISRKGRKKI